MWFHLVPPNDTDSTERVRDLFACVATMMSRQLRELVLDSLAEFLDFFLLHQVSYMRNSDVSASEIIFCYRYVCPRQLGRSALVRCSSAFSCVQPFRSLKMLCVCSFITHVDESHGSKAFIHVCLCVCLSVFISVSMRLPSAR